MTFWFVCIWATPLQIKNIPLGCLSKGASLWATHLGMKDIPFRLSIKGRFFFTLGETATTIWLQKSVTNSNSEEFSIDDNFSEVIASLFQNPMERKSIQTPKSKFSLVDLSIIPSKFSSLIASFGLSSGVASSQLSLVIVVCYFFSVMKKFPPSHHPDGCGSFTWSKNYFEALKL